VNGCARFFNALRDTVSDRIVATYKAGEPRPAIADASAGGTQR
jgi:sarcosine oxidase subunit delta